MNRFLSRLMPFLMMGIIVVIFVAGIILLSYLLIFGAIVGFVLFLISWLRQQFLTPKNRNMKIDKHGRIIEHEKEKDDEGQQH